MPHFALLVPFHYHIHVHCHIRCSVFLITKEAEAATTKKRVPLTEIHIFRNCAKRICVYIFISLMFRGFICYKYRHRHRHFLHTLHVSIVLYLYIESRTKIASVWHSIVWRGKRWEKLHSRTTSTAAATTPAPSEAMATAKMIYPKAMQIATN